MAIGLRWRPGRCAAFCVALFVYTSSLGASQGCLAQSVTAPSTTPAQTRQIPVTAIGQDRQPLCSTDLRKSEELIQKQKFPPAVAAAKAGLRVCPQQADLELALADAQMLNRQFTAAIATLHAFLKKTPDDPGALIMLGQAQYLDDHDDEATASFRRAIAAAPRNPEPRYWLGRLKYQDGNVPDAIKQFKAALQLDPGFYRAWDNLGLCYVAIGQNGHALENYLHALKLVYKDHPRYDDVYINLADLFLHLGKNQEAFNSAAEAVSRNPGDARGYLLAGRALEQAGKDQASLKWMQQAASVQPDYPDPHYQMARIYRREGKRADAKREISEFKTLEAKVPQVRR